jgi:nucleoside diphosphate kinase
MYTTNGGRNMCGIKKGLIGQIFTSGEKEGFKPMTLHCIIH